MRHFSFDSPFLNEFIEVSDFVIHIVATLVMSELFGRRIKPDRRQTNPEDSGGLFGPHELELVDTVFVEIRLDGCVQALAESVDPVKNRLVWMFHNYDLMRVSISEKGRRSDIMDFIAASQAS